MPVILRGARLFPGDAKSQPLLDDGTERDQHRSDSPFPHPVGVGSDTQRNRWVLHLLDSQDRVHELSPVFCHYPSFSSEEEQQEQDRKEVLESSNCPMANVSCAPLFAVTDLDEVSRDFFRVLLHISDYYI